MWWNEEVAEAVREKKKKYRNWRKERSTVWQPEIKLATIARLASCPKLPS